MTATRTRPAEATALTFDPARASFLSGEFSEAKQMTRWVLRYAGTDETHTVTGWSDATECSCTCKGYQFSRRSPAQCRHTIGFGMLLDHVEQERQAARPTNDLRSDDAWFSAYDSYTVDERRAVNAIRAELRRRGVRSLVRAAQGRQAADLYGEAS
jgi:hypothetical protein